MIDKFKLLKKYPNSPEEGTVVVQDDNDDTMFLNKEKTFGISRSILEAYPDYWEINEKAETIEIRIKTDRGTKILQSNHTTELKNGYRFSFPNGISMDIVIDEYETEINFCNNA